MKKVNVNLGSGVEIVKGFINIDAFIDAKDVIPAKDASFIKANMTALPFDDNSVDYIECLDAIQHLSYKDVEVALKEIHRVLKPGGKVYIFTANFSDVAKQWVELIADKPLDVEIWITLSSLIYGNQMHKGEFHKSAFTPEYFNVMMQLCGFDNFTMTGYAKGSLPPSFKGAKWPKKPLNIATIAVEAIK